MGFVAGAFTDLFFPEPSCEGIKCFRGKAEGMCSSQTLQCIDPGTGQPAPAATAPPMPVNPEKEGRRNPFIVYRENEVIFGGAPKSYFTNGAVEVMSGGKPVKFDTVNRAH